MKVCGHSVDEEKFVSGTGTNCTHVASRIKRNGPRKRIHTRANALLRRERTKKNFCCPFVHRIFTIHAQDFHTSKTGFIDRKRLTDR